MINSRRQMQASELTELIARAQADDESARNELFERCRDRLRLQARAAFDDQLGPVWDPSDAAQEALAEASRDFHAFRGRSPEQLFGWLQSILNHTVADRHRFLNRQKRTGGYQYSLEAADAGQPSLKDLLQDEGSSIGRRIVRKEDVGRLQKLIDQLPAEQAAAVRMRHLEGATVEEISERLQRSGPAVAGLLIRAMRSLRERMSQEA